MSPRFLTHAAREKCVGSAGLEVCAGTPSGTRCAWRGEERGAFGWCVDALAGTRCALGLGGEGAHGGGDLGELRRGGDEGGHGVEVAIEGAQPHAALDEKVLCGGHIDRLL